MCRTQSATEHRWRGELACSCGAGLRGRPLGLGQVLLSSRLGAPSVVESFGSATTSPSWRWWRTLRKAEGVRCQTQQNALQGEAQHW